MAKLHQLYRHFDKDGELLYVGISNDAPRRLGQHAISAPWFDRIANLTIETYSSREEAEAAEVAAISTEKPVFNRTHSRFPALPAWATDSYWIGGVFRLRGNFYDAEKDELAIEFRENGEIKINTSDISYLMLDDRTMATLELWQREAAAFFKRFLRLSREDQMIVTRSHGKDTA